LGVAAICVFADRNIELAVGAEVDGAAVVVGRAGEVLEIDHHVLAAGHRHVAVRREAADAVVNRRRRGRVVDVHELIRLKGRVEGDAEQAALAVGVDRDRRERRRQQRSGRRDDPKRSPLLADEQPSVRRKGHRRRPQEAVRDHRLGEAAGQRRRRGWNGGQQNQTQDCST
jgi:hypothetical protein